MAIDYSLVIKRLQRMNEFFALYSAATHMPYVTCDTETGNDQIWMFHDEDSVKEFAAPYLARKIPMHGTRVPKEVMPDFFMDLHAMGINEIVFCDGGSQHKLDLDKVVRIPDFNNLPEGKRPLMNPSLQLSTCYFLQEMRRPGLPADSPDRVDRATLEAMAEEMYVNLARAKFLMPVQIFPSVDGNDRLSLPFITTKQGDNYQPIFSDHTQYIKHTKIHKPMDHTKVLLVGIEDLQKHLLSNVKGYLLNPDGYCHVLDAQQLTLIQQHFHH